MAQLLPLQNVLQQLLRHTPPLPAEETPLEQAVGRPLARGVVADRDIPPWTKSMMDGYAVRSRDLQPGSPWHRQDGWQLRLAGELVAGGVRHEPLEPGQAVKIMTGAPLPPGADAVVMLEHTQELPGEGPGSDRLVHIQRSVAPGENVLSQGSVLGRGQEVLPPGWVLRPQDVGLLAEVGAVRVLLAPRPRVAVLATGDELVPASEQPGPGQIRNSNGPLLVALAASASAQAELLGIARDQQQELARLIQQGLQYDLLLLSGGVSKGTRDLVPAVLRRCGVEPLAHGVALKPGKPLWTGVYRRQGHPRLVFGLPGNPMSTLVCFELFVRPVLKRMQGIEDPGPHFLQAELAAEFGHRGDRTTLFPARLEQKDARWRVTPLRWHGSADIQVLSGSNALVRFDAPRRHWPAGEQVPVLPLSGCWPGAGRPGSGSPGASVCDLGEC